MGTIFQVVHKQRLLSQEIRNVYYYEAQTGDPTDAEWQDIVDEIRADYVAELQSHFNTTWSFYGINRRVVSTAGLLSFDEVPTAGDLLGTDAGNEMPTQVAMLVSVKGTTTKPNRARTYLAGFPADTVNNSVFLSGDLTAAETFVDLQSVLNAAGTNELQRVSAQWNSSHTQVIASNNIAGRASVASQVPATQRRRRIGVGI